MFYGDHLDFPAKEYLPHVVYHSHAQRTDFGVLYLDLINLSIGTWHFGSFRFAQVEIDNFLHRNSDKAPLASINATRLA